MDTNITMVIWTLLIINCACSEENFTTHYVKPQTNSCPRRDMPCLTLNEYINNSHQYFKSNTTFIFLPGQHNINRSVKISNVSDMLWTGTGENSEQLDVLVNVTLDCREQTESKCSAFEFSVTQNVKIRKKLF